MNTKLQTLDMNELAHVAGGFSDGEFSMIATEPSLMSAQDVSLIPGVIDPTVIRRRSN